MRNILDKRGVANKMGVWLGVGVFITVVLLAFMFVGQTIQPTEEEAKIEGCQSTTSPTQNIKAVDKETGTALTEGTNLYRIQGERTWNTFTAGTGFAIDGLQKIDIVMGIDTTDFTDNAYGQMIEGFEIKCTETPSTEFEMANDEIETSLTATFYNNDGDAGAEVFTVGQTQDVSIKLQAGVNEYFGNPYFEGNPNVICLALNTTAWDTPEKVSMRGGVELSRVSTPTRQTGSATATNYCYELPVITEDQVEVVLKLNADDTLAPAVDDTATIYAGNYYYNSDTQEIEFGVENQEGSAVGTDAGDTVTLDYT